MTDCKRCAELERQLAEAQTLIEHLGFEDIPDGVDEYGRDNPSRLHCNICGKLDGQHTKACEIGVWLVLQKQREQEEKR